MILAKSSSVTLDGSATITFWLGVAISYFWFCGLRMTRNAPGSVALEVFVAPFSIYAPSVSVAVAKRHPKGKPAGFSPLVAAVSLSWVKPSVAAGVPLYVMTAGASAVAGVSVEITFALNPY